MSKQFRLRYVTFEEQHVAGSARPKIVPQYHLGKSLFNTVGELLDANREWLSNKVIANVVKGQQVTRIEILAVTVQPGEEQPA